MSSGYNTMDTVVAGDKFAIYAASQSDWRVASGTTVVEFLKSAFSTFTASSYVKVTPTTFALLPAAATAGAGARAFVTDSNTATFNATIAGGGANAVPCFSDGTNWKVG